MLHNERTELKHKLANHMTDICPMEALLQHYYNDQFDYFSDLDDKELKELAEEYLEKDNTCRNCDGTGEGNHSESSCQKCNGKGTVKNDDG